jgi:hypothetical protein
MSSRYQVNDVMALITQYEGDYHDGIEAVVDTYEDGLDTVIVHLTDPETKEVNRFKVVITEI